MEAERIKQIVLPPLFPEELPACSAPKCPARHSASDKQKSRKIMKNIAADFNRISAFNTTSWRFPRAFFSDCFILNKQRARKILFLCCN